MQFRRATVLLLICVVLDFATPMLPGAVEFTDGSLEADAGCYTRKAKDPALAPTPRPPCPSTVLPAPKPTLPTGRVNYVSPPAPVRLRVPLKRDSIPAPAPVDD
jgi:hypothetical protein